MTASTETNRPLSVGFEPIDRDHEEFTALLIRLNHAGNRDFPALFRLLYDHTERHFDRENRLMAEYAFPALAEHQGQHARVLAEFGQFLQRVERGMISFGRAFTGERLPQWFPLHASTMDAALAAHVKSKHLQGR
ncbi:MAG: bacteriohemerythrin [Gammaproteobacteria bacterium]